MKKFILLIISIILLSITINCGYDIGIGCKNLVCDTKKEKEKKQKDIQNFFLITYLIQIEIESKTICKNLSSYQFQELITGQNYSFSVANYRWYLTRNTPSGKIKFQINVFDPNCKIRPYFEYICIDALLGSTIDTERLYGGFLPSENCNTSGCWAQQGQPSDVKIQENAIYYIYRFEGKDNSNNLISCNFNISIVEW
jgi:hypothetical protein